MVADNFEVRTARCGMSTTEIQKFLSDFTEAAVRLALARVQEVDTVVRAFEDRFDLLGYGLDWSDASSLESVGIRADWISDLEEPHRAFLHPRFVADSARWPFVGDYIRTSMVSDKQAKVLFPNLVKKRRPVVDPTEIMREASELNGYLRIVQEAGLTGDRVLAYRGALAVHGRGQNDSGRIGAVGAAAAVCDALIEIAPTCIVDVAGSIPLPGRRTPAAIVEAMLAEDFEVPRALLLVNGRAIIFSADPDIAIISRIGGIGSFESADHACREWTALKRLTADDRQAQVHQSALGEVKTALDPANLHERLALGSRENRDEARASRFLMMAILTPDIVDSERQGRRAMFSRDAQRFQDVFNLYFAWGYDDARSAHPEHWEDFKRALRRWCAL